MELSFETLNETASQAANRKREEEARAQRSAAAKKGAETRKRNIRVTEFVESRLDPEFELITNAMASTAQAGGFEVTWQSSKVPAKKEGGIWWSAEYDEEEIQKQTELRDQLASRVLDIDERLRVKHTQKHDTVRRASGDPDIGSYNAVCGVWLGFSVNWAVETNPVE